MLDSLSTKEFIAEPKDQVVEAIHGLKDDRNPDDSLQNALTRLFLPNVPEVEKDANDHVDSDEYIPGVKG